MRTPAAQEIGFSPANQRRLDALVEGLAAGSPACFDLDGTCLKHDAGEAVFFSMALEGYLETDLDGPALIRSYFDKQGQEGKSNAELWLALLLAGRSPDEVRAYSRAVIERELARPLGRERVSPGVEIATGLRPYRAMGELMQRLERAGLRCWIVSASNRWTVEAWAERFLPVPAERIIAAQPAVEGGRIQPRLAAGLPMTYGPGKVEAIDACIGRRPALAAGNSINDWQMLCAASHCRLAIAPGAALRARIDALPAGEAPSWIVQPDFYARTGEDGRERR
ncbi:MAG: haloacid dehalogenase-like hydrolase [Deltaproteobacteria bacterium]|nr:haloacid dehalogenase-like hydrolase [Deltaproteobacteria bacterium]